MIDLDSLAWWTDFFHKCLTTVGVVWLASDRLWEKIRPIEEFVERRIHERRNIMLNPVTIVADIKLAAKAAEDLQAALPKFGKVIADLKQAYADKANAPAFATDLEMLVSDVTTDIQLLISLFPSTTPPVA